MPDTDSAGVPWEGRSFHENPFAADDGTAPAAFAEAIARFRVHEVGAGEVVASLTDARLLVPLIAELGRDDAAATSDDLHAHGDKSQELSIVTVRAPDGRVALPAFSSVTAMQSWDPAARPVPHAATQVAAAALGEGADLVILDATTDSEFVLRRPALEALASGRGGSWTPPHEDAGVRASIERAAAAEPAVGAVALVDGDPDGRLEGPQLVLAIGLTPGLDGAEVQAVVGRMQAAWTADAVIPSRVDTLAVRVEALP